MLGLRIATQRKVLGISQAQLAKRLHISADALGMYEQGRRIPSADILIGLLKELGVSVDYLLTGELVLEKASWNIRMFWKSY